ncbi:hypothetical protein P8935_23685 [Telmatobacter sp. DSM 110680]|uniref:DUF1579 domain-containing protein n=1 Tax=Telmatobacter sp. DSM 110680 TaxID=3036704 RepID=A0AAU7DKE3_9BACT
MKSIVSRFVLQTSLGAMLMAGSCVLAAAQQSGMPNVDAQREAMKKLGFLAGHWSGPVSISRGPGEPLKLSQTENVQFKLDGLVLLIEGESTGSDGKKQFQALATVAYDDASHAYRFRAFNDGHYIDAELTVQPDGFAWGFETGPAKIQNAMQLTAKGEWQETTDVTFGSAPPHRSVDMLLQHQP